MSQTPKLHASLKSDLTNTWGNARKQLFFGPILYPSQDALRTTRHNKAVAELQKLMLSSTISRCYILMNAGTFNTNPPKNTVPPWLFPCICNHQRCQCNARFKPDILCVRGILYQQNPPLYPYPNIIIQFIKFMYCNDRFSTEKVSSKIAKYQPLLNSIQVRGWNVAPILIITAGARV
jgi:hypothetical protein